MERRSKKGRVFFGCDRYPDCDFVSWDRPVGRNCPECGQMLITKTNRNGTVIQCSKCDYKEEPVEEAADFED
ncbi:DNA topoisomerase 1 [compost metagenome]